MVIFIGVMSVESICRSTTFYLIAFWFSNQCEGGGVHHDFGFLVALGFMFFPTFFFVWTSVVQSGFGMGS